jgi:hypothetical protein
MLLDSDGRKLQRTEFGWPLVACILTNFREYRSTGSKVEMAKHTQNGDLINMLLFLNGEY